MNIDEKKLLTELEEIFNKLSECLKIFINSEKTYPYHAAASALGDLYLNVLLETKRSRHDIQQIFLNHLDIKITDMKKKGILPEDYET